MEEKILFQSKTKLPKTLLIPLFYIASIVLFIIPLSVYLSNILTFWKFEEILITLYILSGITFVLTTIFLIIFLGFKNCHFIVTDKNIKGNGFFGKEIILPTNTLASYSTTSFLSRVKLKFTSGTTVNFTFIENYTEIENVFFQNDGENISFQNNGKTEREKILVRSETKKSAKIFFKVLISFFYSAAVILFLCILYDIDDMKKKTFIALCIPTGIIFVLGTILLIIFLGLRKCNLIITDKNVRGNGFFGKKVVLPIYMISSYSTSSILAIVKIASSSGITKFAFIKNYIEIGNVLSQIINDRQENTITTNTSPAKNEAPTSSNIDDLVKLKSLLDQGIITQEEFDAKKKEILGL